MKRAIFSLLLLILLSTPVRGAEVSGAVALTFEEYAPQVVETLDEFGAKGTFFLTQASWETLERLLEGEHEIGLTLAGEGDMTGLSRRQIYERLQASQAFLPEKYRPIWVRPPEKWGDGFRQVTQATRFSLLRWSLDARKGLTASMIDQIRSGDVIALGNPSRQELTELISILHGRDLKLVTVTELTDELAVDIIPGRLYQKFPVQQTGNFRNEFTYRLHSGHPPAHWGCRR